MTKQNCKQIYSKFIRKKTRIIHVFLITLMVIILSKQIALSQNDSSFCGFIDAPKTYCKLLQDNLFEPSQKANELINRILKPTGITPSFFLEPCAGIQNCVAHVTDGFRYIYYDKDYIDSLNIYFGNNWSEIFILCHEMGHHLCGHTIRPAQTHEEQREYERQADKFAGFILQKLGATLAQATEIFRKLKDPVNPIYSNHPPLAERIGIVTSAFNDAKSLVTLSTTIPINQGTEKDMLVYNAYYSLTSKNYVAALSSYKAAYKIDSTSIPVIIGLAKVYENTNKYNSSLYFIKKAQVSDTSNYKIVEYKSDILKLQGKFKESINAINVAINLNISDVDLYNKKAILYKQIGKNKEANEILKTAREINNQQDLIR